MKKLAGVGLALAAVVVGLALWLGRGEPVETVYLPCSCIDEQVIGLLQYDPAVDDRLTKSYFVDFMLRSCGLEKRWVEQLPMKEKEQFMNARRIDYFQAEMTEGAEVVVIVAQLPDERLRLACAVSASAYSAHQSDRLWIYVPGYRFITQNGLRMDQWFAGEAAHGASYWEPKWERDLSQRVSGFTLRYEDFPQRAVDEAVFYLSGDLYAEGPIAAAEMAVEVYYQPQAKGSPLGEISLAEAMSGGDPLKQIGLQYGELVDEERRLLRTSIQGGWIGCGRIVTSGGQ